VPKSHVYRVLRSGEVRVNSGRVGPDYRLQIGDRVRVPPVRVSTTIKTAKPAEFPIVHEDAALLVVDKPAGVAVHGGSGRQLRRHRVFARLASADEIPGAGASASTGTPPAC